MINGKPSALAAICARTTPAKLLRSVMASADCPKAAACVTSVGCTRMVGQVTPVPTTNREVA